MDTAFFVKGLIIGFSIAAPVGPIGLLCMQRTLNEGQISGFISGLGAATADAVYGCVAGFGLTAVSTVLINEQLWFRLVGGVFLCFLGARTFFSVRAEKVSAKGKGLLKSYGSTFVLTITNPMTIISFAAIFAGLGVGGEYTSAVLLVLGVFAGSSFWWFILSTGTSVARSRVDSHTLRWVNRISGLVLVGVGSVVLAGLLIS